MFTLRTTSRALALGATLYAVLAFASAPGAAAEEAANECTDTAWASYNTCLMNSGNLEWAKRECDAEFTAEYAACYPKIFAGIFFMASKAT